MSLLQGLLRSKGTTTYGDARMDEDGDIETSDSDYEFVSVVSIPGTPARSRPVSPDPEPGRTNGNKSGLNRTLKPLTSKKGGKVTDPLRTLPTELSQRIFGALSIKDLARCARVCKRWRRSQSINYVWFLHYRKDNFCDDSLPPGKWTKRESKQNWRVIHLSTVAQRSTETYSSPPSRGVSNTNYSSGGHSGSGDQTPREVREERWRAEAEGAAKPGKVEMRSMYKEMGGRKAKTKTKMGREGEQRDKGGWGGGDFE
ncbi:hypothetical protein BDV98DRAFT_550929 [Pterulicium gracile]|uniref:F-box domain-containing protein n=1 Tax=Pterulicium gracile TaxID=1884261 RepID=A0A5C3QEM9_9AGAR|nr:hypothetical protein BDV98DRAFT_550929 [Pterula gracilis]